MTPRVRAVLVLAVVFVVVLAVAAGLAYTAGLGLRVDDLDRRVTHLETDVSSLRE